MKKIFFLSIVYLSVWVVNAQQNIQESVYLQVNDQFLITGETLLFSAFCNSEATGLPSHLSKILYVELIGGQNRVIFQQKIPLVDGHGSGEFFISSLIPTGSYQLLAYTRWMKNFNQYYQSKIEIVNPFEQYEIPNNTSETSISFVPEGGVFVAGETNRIAIKTSNPAMEKGKVTNEEGETVAEFSIDNQGYGLFELKDAGSQSYRGILEDTLGNFYFENLPDVTRDGVSIQLNELPGTYELNVIGQIPDQTRLLVSDGQNLVLDVLAKNEINYSIENRSLKPGVYKAFINLNESELCSRLFAHHSDDHLTDLTVQLEKSNYAERSEVKMTFASREKAQVAISVRKVSPLSHKSSIREFEEYKHIQPYTIPRSINDDSWIYFADWQAGGELTLDEVALLPEVRGGLVSGKILPTQKDQIVAFSTIGEKYQLQTTTISDDGSFLFQVEEGQRNVQAYIGLVQPDSVRKIMIDSPFLTEYPSFDYSQPILDSADIMEIVEKSRRNQVENAYFSLKQDTAHASLEKKPIFTDFDSYYLLDDYNRFPQLHEHFIEYIPTVVARKTKNRSKIKVILQEFMYDDYPPLLLLDGLPVTVEEILEFSPYKIRSIGVINHRIYLDDLVADGLVVFETFEHNLMDYEPLNYQRAFTYQGLEVRKSYHFPDYTQSNELSRIPDYRDQLYWNPYVNLNTSDQNEFHFYTGDVKGEFEIIAEGYTESGKPISYKGYFTVQ